MKTKKIKYLMISLSIFLVIGSSCDKSDDLPLNHAKGTIIAITGECYGEIVLIEVDQPHGIGVSGTFSTVGKPDESLIYQNAIGVPYFSKIGLPDSIPQTVGTWLHFEYRELNEDEKTQSKLFSPDPPIVCTDDIIPPSAKRLIITKVINYK